MSNKKKTDIIVERILSQQESSGISSLLEGTIEPTDFQSFLLKAYENLALRATTRGIVYQYETNRFVQPCDLDQKELLCFDSIIYKIVPDTFTAIELSPVNPLGINSALSKINQKNVLSTVRNVEVIADITTALALECAKRRKQIISKNPLNAQEVNICSSHRSIRLQQFAKELGFTPHFRVFGACTAGRDTGHEKFESENLIDHISIYLDLFYRAESINYYAHDITVSISDIRITETLISFYNTNREELMMNTQTKEFNPFNQFAIPQTVNSPTDIPKESINLLNLSKSVSFLSEIEKKALKELREKYPMVCFQFDLHRIAGIGYYENLCFKITARDKNGTLFPLADGGLTDWTKKLLSSRKERLFASGFGSELFCRNFKK